MTAGPGNISLIGFMGSGKSTTGRLLADILKKRFVDIDKVIELSQGMSISRIFRDKGEEYFRDIETNVIKKLYGNNKTVFACGGGVILRKKNMDVIKKSSKVIYLRVSAERLLERLQKDKDSRPLVAGRQKDSISAMIKSREEKYEEYSDYIIDCDEFNPEEISRAIINKTTVI